MNQSTESPALRIVHYPHVGLREVAKTVRDVLSHASQGGAQGGELAAMLHDWDDGADCAAQLTHMLVTRPPLMIGDEDTIAPGVDADLDELRALRDGGKEAIATIQQQERARPTTPTPQRRLLFSLSPPLARSLANPPHSDSLTSQLLRHFFFSIPLSLCAPKQRPSPLALASF